MPHLDRRPFFKAAVDAAVVDRVSEFLEDRRKSARAARRVRSLRPCARKR
jgi:hypothetical protein